MVKAIELHYTAPKAPRPRTTAHPRQARKKRDISIAICIRDTTYFLFFSFFETRYGDTVVDPLEISGSRITASLPLRKSPRNRSPVPTFCSRSDGRIHRRCGNGARLRRQGLTLERRRRADEASRRGHARCWRCRGPVIPSHGDVLSQAEDAAGKNATVTPPTW